MAVCLVSQRLGEYFYQSKLFFKIQTQQTMNTIEQKSLKVGSYVNTEHVDTIVRNYKKERWLQNSERIGKEDTLNLWLSAEELEEFIQTAKMHGADGIRVCFGVYGEKCPKPGMEGKQTVAFVATASELNDDGYIVHNDLNIGDENKPSLVAYNMINPWFPPPSSASVGSVMVADKDNGLQII